MINLECNKCCYIFHTGHNSTSNVYNISKYPLPKNCEVKLFFEEEYLSDDLYCYIRDLHKIIYSMEY